VTQQQRSPKINFHEIFSGCSIFDFCNNIGLADGGILANARFAPAADIRAKPAFVWHALDAAYEGGADYRKTGNLRAVQLLLGHAKPRAPSGILGSRKMMP
jgi:hypothetical protein